jgi:hypothetical protein
MAALALEVEEAAEVSPLTRVRRGRAAIALSVTLAAMPVLVLDNLPAQAQTSDEAIAAVADIVAESSSTLWDIPSTTTTTAAPTSTTAAPTTTAAPATTATAPPTTTAHVHAAAAPAPAPAPPPTTTTTRAPAAANGDPDDPETWEKLAQCESGGNWSMSSGNGYYGGLQFSLASWRDVGGTGYPHEHTKAEQIYRGKILQARYGWDQWPTCARQLGYM